MNVYMPTHFREKQECWKSLMELKDTEFVHNSIIRGDFNTTMGNHEKRGGSIIRDAQQEHMEDLILTLNLFDVKPQKFVYTWTNKRVRVNHIAARQDRFLAVDNLLILNYNLKYSILPWSSSGHRLISLIISQPLDLAQSPFATLPYCWNSPISRRWFPSPGQGGSR